MTYRLDTLLLMTWLLIVALGTVMITSSALVQGNNYPLRHGIFMILALAGFLFCLTVPLNWWQKMSRLAWVGSVVLCVLVLLIGTDVKGATRRIDLPGFALQASEIAKFLMLIFFAGYLSRFHGRLADEPMIMVRLLLLYGLVAVLLLKEPDFGTVVVLAATLSGMLFLGGVRLRHFLVVIIGGVSVLAMLAVIEPYRFARLVAFLDPWANPDDGGYQLIQALIAFGRGEFFGLGLGEGVQKMFYLPEAHTDFIFAVIAEELGMVGTLSLLGLFVLLILRLLRIARQATHAENWFASYLVYGIALIIGLQAVINMGVSTGALPTKGLTLPFVSYGGNSLIVCCMLIGLAFRAQMETADG